MEELGLGPNLVMGGFYHWIPESSMMSNYDDDASQLQIKMSQLRSRIAVESEKAAEETRRALDWKHQVASHPLMSAAIAMAVGYMLIPRRKIPSEAASIGEIQNLLEKQSQTPAPRLGMGKTLALAAGSVLIRSLVSGSVNKAIALLATRCDRSSTGLPSLPVKQDLNATEGGEFHDG